MLCKYGKKRKEVLLDRWRSHHIIGKRRTRRNILLVARMNVFSPLRHCRHSDHRFFLRCRDSDHRFFLLFAPITPPFSTKEERSMVSSLLSIHVMLREIKVWKEQEEKMERERKEVQESGSKGCQLKSIEGRERNGTRTDLILKAIIQENVCTNKNERMRLIDIKRWKRRRKKWETWKGREKERGKRREEEWYYVTMSDRGEDTLHSIKNIR